ncbi:MAG: hypothetical protein P0Y64_09610 [Candidatus Sphingomonas colombiensis]|nr:hypothetical protein [Sphingomonas sp.]WEK41686.1 MAG: hypothetical protein P0Y64_09610 [Sphingomonas sp.]
MRRLSAVATCLAARGCCIPPATRTSTGRYPSALTSRVRADYPPPRPQQPPPQRPQPQSQPQPRAPDQQLPAPRPAWETRGAEADARDVPAQSYVVRPGETLSEAADRTGAGHHRDRRRQRARPRPMTIRAGQRLTIPPGRYHLVRQGQTGHRDRAGLWRAHGRGSSSANDLV